jgi:hypothetical protein
MTSQNSNVMHRSSALELEQFAREVDQFVYVRTSTVEPRLSMPDCLTMRIRTAADLPADEIRVLKDGTALFMRGAA